MQATSEGELLPSTLQGASILRSSTTHKTATAMASPSKLVCLNEARSNVPLKCAPSPAEKSRPLLGRSSWFPGATTFALCKVMVKRSTAEPIFVEALFLLMGGTCLIKRILQPLPAMLETEEQLVVRVTVTVALWWCSLAQYIDNW